jgi:hypothetical protein
MNEAYWRERCAAAEAALAKARSAISMNKGRRAILSALGDLRQGEWIDAESLAACVGGRSDNAFRALQLMELYGLVEREPGRIGVRGAPNRWRLGHLVQVEALDGADAEAEETCQ